MLPDRVSNPGPLTYESGALPIELRGPSCCEVYHGIQGCEVYGGIQGGMADLWFHSRLNSISVISG